MIYIYDSIEVAKSIVMTAYYLGYECHAVGSAVVMDEGVYNSVMDTTRAPKAAIVAYENTGKHKLFKE